MRVAALLSVSLCAGPFAAAQNAAPVVDPDTPPAIVQDAGDPTTFALGDEIVVTVTFDRAVTVTGTPRIALDIGGVQRYANYAATDGAVLRFRYRVQAGDEDADGLDILADSLELRGGTITGAGSADAELSHPGQAATATRRPVDGVVPTVIFGGKQNSFVHPDGLVPVFMLFSEQVTGLTLGDFVISNGTPLELDGDEVFQGQTNILYTLQVDPHGEGPFTLTVPANAGQDAAGNGNAASAQYRRLIGSPATVTIAPATSSSTEGEPLAFDLSRSMDNGPRTVRLQVSQQGDFLDGTTSFGAMLATTPAAVSVGFSAGETTRSLTFGTDDDYLKEAAGSVTVTVLADPTEVGYVVGTPSSATVAVQNDDEPPDLFVYLTPAIPRPGVQASAVTEGERLKAILIRSADAGPQTLDVEVTQEGDFLAANHPGGVTIPADGRIQVSFAAEILSAYLFLNTRNDSVEEDDGSVTVAVLPRPDDPMYPIDRLGSTTMAVRDNDTPPTVTVAAVSGTVTEGDSMSFTVTRSTGAGVISRAMVAFLEVTDGGDQLAPGADSRPLALFTDGVATATVTLATADDRTPEAVEPVTLRVRDAPPGSVDPYLVGSPGTASVAVLDDDDPVVSVAALADTVTEGDDALYRVTRIGSTVDSLTVWADIYGHYKVMSDATRTLAANTGLGPDTTVTIAAGASEAILTVTTEADRVNEGDGELRAVIKSTRRYEAGVPGSATVLVEDDDIPEVNLKWLSPAEITLQDNVWVGTIVEGTEIDYEVTCSGNTVAPSRSWIHRIVAEHEEVLNHPRVPRYNRHTWARHPCSARTDGYGWTWYRDASRRYTGPGNGEITVRLHPQALEARHFGGQSRCFLNDYSGTPEELRFCPKYTLGAVTSARIAVMNRSPTIVIEAVEDEVDEGEAAQFRLTRIWNDENVVPIYGYETTVDFTSASSGGYVDGEAPAGTRTFGRADTEIIIEVPTVQDQLQGPDGSVTLEILPGTPETQSLNVGGTYEVYDQLDGITPAGKSSRVATVTILNKDMVPLLTVPDAAAEEGEPVEFVATLSSTHATDATVEWSLTPGLAEAGTDYTDAAGTLTFAAGETVATVTVDTVEDAIRENYETFTMVLGNPVQMALARHSITGTIENDDSRPTISVTASAATVVEGDAIEFAVTRRGLIDRSFQAQLGVYLDGTFETHLETVFPVSTVSEDTMTLTYHTQDDSAVEPDRVLLAVVHPFLYYGSGDPDRAAVTILDNDADRNLQLARTSPASFSASDTALTFAYTVTNLGNVATRGAVEIVDTLLGTFDCGTEAIPAAPVGDGEDPSTAACDAIYTVTADDRSNGVIVSTAYATDRHVRSDMLTTHVVADGYAYYVLSPNLATVSESEGSIAFTVTRGGNTSDSTSVGYATQDGGAKSGSDYTATDAALTFAAGVETRTFTVSIIDDLIDEDVERFMVALKDTESTSVGDSARILDQSDVWISDDDPGVAIGVEQVVNSVAEDAGTAEIAVGLYRGSIANGFAPSGRPVSVRYATRDGTAVAGQDYTEKIGQLLFKPGQTVKKIPVSITDDLVVENREEFWIDLTESQNALTILTSSVEVHVRDNDRASTSVSLDVDPAEVAEGVRTEVTVTATLNRAVRDTALDLAIALDGRSATEGADYAAVETFTLQIPAYSATGTGSFTLDPTDDDIDEEPESIAVVGSTSESLVIRPQTGKLVRIVDDDERGVRVGPAALRIEEGQSDSYAVVLTSEPTGTVTVGVSVAAESEVTVAPPALTFAPAEWSTAKQVTVTTTADTDAEEEQATVRHTAAGADYGTVTVDDVVVTVGELDDPTTAIVLTADRRSVAEGGGATTITVTAELDQATLTEAITVSVNVGGGTAEAGTDFSSSPGAFDMVIPAGVGSGTGTFSLTPVNDAVDEDDESIEVGGEVTTGGAFDADTLPVTGTTVVIEDDDTRGVELSPTELTIPEGSRASYTVRFASAPSELALVEVAGTGRDLRASPTGLFFDRNNWSLTRTVTIVALRDDDVDQDVVTLGHTVTGGDYRGIAVPALTVTVTEPISSAMTVADVRAAEGDGSVDFEVVLGHAIAADATVEYRTVGMTSTNGVTARTGEDFTDTSGTLTFAAGVRRHTVSVALVDDTLNEADEFFELVLENPVNAELPPPDPSTRTVRGTIEDDDPLPAVTVAGTEPDGWSYGDESKHDLVYAVRLSGASRRQVAVDYGTDDRAPGNQVRNLDIASSSLDYVALSGTLTFAAGETEKLLTVEVTDDAISENNEVFGFRLSNPRNAVVSNQGWGLIRDNDARGVRFAPQRLRLVEGSEGTYSVVLTSQPTAPVTVTLTPSGDLSVDQSALAFSGSNWNKAQTVKVTAEQDADSANVTARVTHSFAGGDYQGVPPASFIVLISDDDDRGITVQPEELTVSEGGSGYYTVVLDSMPTGAVTVSIDGAFATDLNVATTRLTFAAERWATAQTVQVTARQDADAVDDVVALTNRASGADYGVVSAKLTVTVSDDDTESTQVALSVNPATVAESAAATAVTVTGTLNHAARTSATTVTVTVGAAADAAVEGTDYATVGSVTVTIAAGHTSGAATFLLDPIGDDVDETDDTLTVSGSTGVSGLTVTGTTVTITDDDTRGVEIRPTTLPVAEGGTGSYTVVLTSAPTGAVTVTPSVAGSGDVTVSGAALTFTASDWDAEQTVTVSARQDADAEDDTATVSHAVAGADYASERAVDVAVTVDDDETPSSAVLLSVNPATVAESAAATTVTVTGTLNAAPRTSATTVTVSVGAADDAAVEGTDYATVGSVTVTIAAGQASGTGSFALDPTGDDVDESDETLSVSGSSSGGLAVTGTAVTITDDDTRGVTVSEATLTVTEGGTGRYTVVLDSEPTGAVTVAPSVTGSGDVTVSGAALTFTASDWDAEQTVTVSAGSDADADHDTATVSHAVAGADYGSNSVTAASVAVTVDDDETPSTAVVLSVDPATVAESADATAVTVTGTLNDAPRTSATTVTVSVGADDDAAVEGTDYATVGSVTVTIAAGQASGTGSFELDPTGDDVDEGDETLSVSGSSSGGLAVTGTAVTIIDDDTRGVTVSEATLTVTEGGTGRYTVVLDSEPTGAVTVAPSVTGSGDVTVSGAALTFTASDWEDEQTLTVHARQDADADHDTATVSHAVAGADYGSNSVTAASVAVTVDDDEAASTAVVLSVNPASVAESAAAATVTVTAALNHAPRGTDTTVTVTVGDPDDPATEGTDYTTVGTVALTITAGEASGTETFSLDPTDDDVDEGNETLSVTGTTTATGLSVTGTTVTITDDDTRGVTVSPTTLPVAEGGTAAYTVVLDSEPTGDVTVTPSVSGSDEVTASPEALTFTATTWDAEQTVTVSAGQDDDGANDQATVSHAVAGGDYGAETADDVTVTVDDDETAMPALSVELDEPEHDDQDATGTVTLGDVLSYTATASNTGNVPLSAVTLSALLLVNGTEQQCGTLAIGKGCQLSGDYTVTQADVDAGTVANTATATAAELGAAVTASRSTAVAQERALTLAKTATASGFGATGETLNYRYEVTNSGTVTLTGTVSITDDKIASEAIACGTVAAGGLAPGGTVTCSGSYETVQADVDGSGVTNRATARLGGVASAAVTLRVPWQAPHEQAPRLTPAGAGGSEDAGALAVTVTLNPASLQTVMVDYATEDGTAAAGTDYTAATGTLTLAPGATAGTISVAIADDAVDEEAETFTVRLSDAVNATIATRTTAVTITDNDTRGVEVSPTTLPVPEGGESTYTVVLTSAPTGAVTVTPSATGSSDVTVSGAALTFTAATWNAKQTVTVSARSDPDAEDETATVSHGVAGADYAAETADDVAVKVDDDETASTQVALSVSPVSVVESAAATTVAVTATLNHAPRTSDTTVTVAVGATDDAAAEGTDYATVGTATLTITAGRTSGTGSFELDPTGDDVDEPNEPLSVTGSTTVTGLSVTGATVTITDDDTRGVTVSPPSLTVTEGSTNTYTVVLDSEPTGTVTVTPSATGSPDVMVSDAALTFTAANWYDAQTVTVSADQDTDAVNDTATVSHAVAGADYGMNSVTAASVAVTVGDDETASTLVALSVSPASVAEGADAMTVAVTAMLNNAPRLQDTTVTVTVGADGDVAMEGTDYATVATVTVTIAAGQTSGTETFALDPTGDDVDENDETLAVTGSTGVSGLQVSGATVTIIDDDTRGVQVSPTTLPVAEGGTGSYTVVLNSAPTGAVTVTARVTGSADVTASPEVLTFLAATWDFKQTVTVTAAGDADAVNDTATVSHALAGGDYGLETADDVAVTVGDDDTRGVVVRPTALPVAEGGTASYTVALASAPTGDVTVTPSVTGSGDVTVGAAVLTFTASTWNAAQTVTVSAQQDVDETNDTVTVSHTVAGADYGSNGVTADSVSVTVADDDGTVAAVPVLTLSVNPASIGEAAPATPVAVTGTLNIAVPEAVTTVTVTVGAAGDTATEGTDYKTVGTITLTIEAGATSGTATFELDPQDDAEHEADETVTVGGTAAGVTVAPATLTITDDDTAAVGIATVATEVEEGHPALFTVTRSGAGPARLTVPVAVTESGSVVAEAAPTEVTFAAGASTVTLSVATADDETDEPNGTITATLGAGTGYVLGSAASATVAVTDNDAAPRVSIADVSAQENAGAMGFVVRLSAASGYPVSVVCASVDDTATAGHDYAGELDTLVLTPGQTSATISIPIFDDALDETDETFRMVLTSPANGTLADGEATGTIIDDDPSVVEAWLVRFARTIAGHVVDAVVERVSADANGSRASLAGRRLSAVEGAEQAGHGEAEWRPWEPAAAPATMEFAELLAGSSFELSLNEPPGPVRGAGGRHWSAWGRGGTARIAGDTDRLTLQGQVTGGVAGVDYDWGAVLAGVSAGYHGGAGEVEVRGADQGVLHSEEVASWLLSVHPYVALDVTERAAVWAVFGHGRGGITLDGAGGEQETATWMTMGAAGVRGVLVAAAEAAPFGLAVRADGMALRTGSEAAGRLPAVSADVQRARVVLEGSVEALRGPVGVLTPTLEVGARYDGGAAETGAGLEVGGGLRYAYPAWGVTAAASGRLLVAHEERGFEQWGAGGSLRVAPGQAGAGPALTVSTAWGDEAGRVEQLWSQGVGLPGGPAANDAAARGGRLVAELSYGVALPGGSLTPFAGVGLDDDGAPAYRLGSRLILSPSFNLSLQGERRAHGGGPIHELQLRATLRW